MSIELLARKTGIVIIPTAFIDHHAVVIRITIPDYELRRRRSRWKLHPMLMKDEKFRAKIRNEKVKWWLHKRYYHDVALWWERQGKKHLQRLIRQEKTEIHRNHTLIETTYMNVSLTSCEVTPLRQKNLLPCNGTRPK
jgi:hypothetical protein